MIIQNAFPILFQRNQMDEVRRVVRQHGSPSICVQLPWAMIEYHEDQAIKNHSQSITRLAERGGLSSQEALAVLEDRPYKNMGYGEANARLLRKLERWEAALAAAPASDAEPVERLPEWWQVWDEEEQEWVIGSSGQIAMADGLRMRPLYAGPETLP